MRHELSITGDVETLYSLLPELDEICAEGDSNRIVFSAETPDKMSALKEKLVSRISDIIIDRYEDGYRSRLLKTHYKNLSADEMRDVSEALAAGDKTTKRKDVEKEIREYLPENDTLFIDGFVNFRLRDYKRKLKRDVDRAVQCYITEREYLEFISLLRCFVEMQFPREAVVHVVPGDDGAYSLYNSRLSRITSQGIEELELVMDAEGLSFDDLLLSSLITLAPMKIVIHNHKSIENAELVETISEIFIDCVSFCSGCSLCDDTNRS